MSNEFINLGSANNDRADFQLRYISISKTNDNMLIDEEQALLIRQNVSE